MPPRRLTKGIEEEVYTGTWQGEVVGLSHRVAAAFPGFTTEPDARNVEFTTDQQMFQIGAIVFDGADLDAWRSAAETGEEVGQHIAGDQRGYTEMQLARLFWHLFGK